MPRSIRAWLTPDEYEGPTVICRPFSIPLPMLPYVTGALALLTEPHNWEQAGTMSPETAAELMTAILDGWEGECEEEPPPPAFSPLDIVGLTAWYDFSDGATLFEDSALTIPAADDGDVVGGVLDKCGEGWHITQETTANKPILKTAIQNGKSVIRCSGNHRLSTVASPSIPSRQPLTLFVVSATDVHNAKLRVATWGNSGWAYGVRISAGGDAHFETSAKLYNFADGWATVSVMAVHAVVFDADFDATLYVNAGVGETVLHTAQGFVGSNGLGIGGKTGGFWDGDIAELLIYDSALGTTDREAVRNYLNEKWAVYV